VTAHPQHEAILLDCLTQGDPRRALGASAARGCEVCADRIDELMEVQERLNSVGRELGAIRANPTAAPGEHLVEAALGQRLALRRRSRWLTRAALGSAAAALLFLALLLMDRSKAKDPGPTLGGIDLELLAPREPVPAFQTFTWRGRLPTDGWYEFRVLTPDGRELARSTTEESRWTSESTADWPIEIRWQVRAFDASGALLQALEGSASRSSP
jgi:hypothetical protein